MLAHVEEQVFLDERRHGIVLARPLARALALAVLGVTGFAIGWPLSLAGATLLAASAGRATAGVWQWGPAHVVAATQKLFVGPGGVRKRAAACRPATGGR